MTPVDRLAWVADVAADVSLPASTVRVACILAYRARDGRAWPSEAALADGTGLSQRHVRRALHALADAGWMTVEQHAVGKRADRKCNRYTLRNGGTQMSARNGGTQVSGRTKCVATGGHGCPVEQGHEQGINPQPPSSDSDEPTDEQAKRVLAVYADTVKPPRLDSSRSRAKRHLEKLLRKHSVDHLLASVANYAADMDAAGTEAKYRRNAGNFFGQDADFEQYLPDVYEPPLSEQDKRHAEAVAANWDEIMQMEAELDDGEGE